MWSAPTQYMTTTGTLVAAVDQGHIVSIELDQILTTSFSNPQSKFINFESATVMAASIHHGSIVF